MQQSDELIEQLGISIEEAAFLQQVLDEVGNESETDSISPETIVAETVDNSILQKAMEDNNDSTSRFSSAIWYDKIQQQTIILAGLGGIGSYVNFLLSRMHPASIFIYDDDTVETANLSGQMYTSDDVGKLKTTAVIQHSNKFSGYGSVFAVDGRFTANSQGGDIMICGFDNMEARKTFFHAWQRHVRNYTDMADRAKCLFIDGRLAAERFQVFCIKGDDEYSMQQYEEHWLFDDSEAEETICSYKQTSFCANMIASIMVNCFVNFIANQCDPLIPRDVPFFTEYDASMMFFKTET